MGPAQAVQAEACCRPAEASMNPILLKPCSEIGSEVVIRGRSTRYLTAQDYYASKPQLPPMLQALLVDIAQANDLIVMEGAGSPVELNLNQDDIVNMGLARLMDSPVILVADIDRGGVFASIYGTLALMDPADRDRVKGIVVNKFRGDRRLFNDGVELIESLTGVPVLGVLPYLELALDSEDSLSLDQIPRSPDPTKILDIAVLNLGRLTNFQDLEVLAYQPGVSVRLVDQPRQFGQPDLLIIPDIHNLDQVLVSPPAEAMRALVQEGLTRRMHLLAFGRGCGLVGEYLASQSDKGVRTAVAGWRLTPVSLKPLQKMRRRQLTLAGGLKAYELTGDQLALTSAADPSSWIVHEDSEGRVVGLCDLTGQYRATTLHGLFTNEVWTHELLNQVCVQRGLPQLPAPNQTYQEWRQANFDDLADQVSQHLNLTLLDQIIGGSAEFKDR